MPEVERGSQPAGLNRDTLNTEHALQGEAKSAGLGSTGSTAGKDARRYGVGAESRPSNQNPQSQAQSSQGMSAPKSLYNKLSDLDPIRSVPTTTAPSSTRTLGAEMLPKQRAVDFSVMVPVA